MFKPSNFCHIASNNRNEVKAGVFVYKTTDDLQTVLGRGYFNKKIIDLNLHDLIIHVQENNADKTVVQKNTLCVVGKTLDDVITDVIKSDWQESIEDAITELQHTDTNLQTQITANKNAIDKEITDRTDADSGLQEQITKNAGDITTLQNNIDTVSGNLSTHINDKNNPHAVTKAQVGLGNVDNTSDADKPVSNATQTELNKKENTSNKVTTITSSSTNVQYPSAKAAKDYADKAAGLAGNPVGAMISFGGTTPPSGYLKCDGALISRTTYANLFAVIGTSYTNALYAWTLASADPATVYTASETPAVGDSVYLADGTESTTITAVATGTITTSVGTYARATASDNTTTFNLPDRKDHTIIETQEPTADNNYTWYRLYSDCWVEQGGRYANKQNILTTMPVAMSDTNYSVVLTCETDSGAASTYSSFSISVSKTTTSFTIKNAGSIFGGWQVSGMSASTPVQNIICIKY